MYYVKLEMTMLDGSVTHIGTNSTRELQRAVSQLEAYRNCAESLVMALIISSYELKLGTIPSDRQ